MRLTILLVGLFASGLSSQELSLGQAKPFTGSWQFDNGLLKQSAADYDTGAAFAAQTSEQFLFTIEYRAVGDFQGAGLFFNMQKVNSKHPSQMVRVDPDGVMYGHFDASGEFQFAGLARAATQDRDWHTLSVAVDNKLRRYNIFFDGKKVAENLTVEHAASGFIGLQSSGGPHEFRRASLGAPTAEQLAGLKMGYPFNQPRSVAVNSKGEIFVAHRGKTPIIVLQKGGGPPELCGYRVVREIGKLDTGEDAIADPAGIRITDEGLWVADKRGQKFVLLNPETGAIISKITEGADGERVVSPVDVATRGGFVFLLDQGANGAHVYSTRSESVSGIVGGEKGRKHGELDGPTAICADQLGNLFIADPKEPDHIRIENFKYNMETHHLDFFSSSPWMLGTRSIAVNSKNEKIILGKLGYYESGGVIRQMGTNWEYIGSFGAFALGGMSQFGGVACGPDDEIYVVDTAEDRLLVLPPSLADADKRDWTWGYESEFVNIAQTSNTREKLSLGIDETRLGIYRSPTEIRPKQAGEVLNPKPGEIYELKLPSPFITIPYQPYTRTVRVLSAPQLGQMAILNKKVLCAIFLKTDHGEKRTEIPRAKLGRKVFDEFQKTREFYLRNSGFRYNLNIDYIIVDDDFIRETGVWVDPGAARKLAQQALTRNGGPDVMSDLLENSINYTTARSMGGALPMKGEIVQLKQARQDIGYYESLIALYAEDSYDASKPDDLGDVGGGGLTPFGYSSFGMGGKMAWLLCHEFNHQVDAYFDRSGAPEYWLNHPDWTVHPGTYGAQWDCNAVLFRSWPEWAYFEDRFSEPMFVTDADNDGVPDSDLRLALDEVRMGFDSKKAKTDGENEDKHKTMMGIFTGGDPMSKDTDADGIPDSADEYPLYPINAGITRKTPTIDGKLEPSEWTLLNKIAPSTRKGAFSAGGGSFVNTQADVYCNWDDGYLYFAISADQPIQLHLDLDCWGDGWFTGPDNQAIRIDARDPYNVISNGPAKGILASASQDAGVRRYVLEIAVPKDGVAAKEWKLNETGSDNRYGPDGGNRGPKCKPGAKFGVQLMLFGPEGHQNWLFEPYRNVILRCGS